MNVYAAFFQSLAVLSLGLVVACVGLLLIGGYREEMLRDLRGALRLDVLVRIGSPGGPRYSGVLVLCAAAVLIAMGFVRTLLIGMLYVAHAAALLA